MTKKIEKFTGIVKKQIYNGDNFKVYSLEVNKEAFPKVKFNKFGDVTIVGNLHDLVLEMPYDVVGEEAEGKYGYNYKVKNIKAVKDDDSASVYTFLRGILTGDQADTLYRLYPDIVDLVISNKADEVVDLNQTKGIKQKTFAVIKRKIIENYVLFDLIAEFDGLLTVSVLKNIYDKYPSIEKIRELIKQDPYDFFTQLSRVGFKKADSMLLNMQKNGKLEFDYDLKTSKERCMSAMVYLLEENENEGNTRLRLKTLKQQIDNLVPECAGYFVDCLKDNRFYYDLDRMVVARRSTYEVEVFIADRIKDALTKNIVWDFDIEKYRKTDEGDLTDEQMSALKNICENNIAILSGSAGCVDCDTEYFNGYEWKKISQYYTGDKVLQYNKDGTAELIYPIRYIKEPEDYLWHFKTKYGLDQCLSDDHEVYYVTSKGNLYHKKFKEVRENQNTTGFLGRFLTTFDYSGNGIELSDDWIRIMIAVFADGSFYSSYSEKTEKKVRFHIKKERKKERLEMLLNKAKINYSKVKSATHGYDDYYFYVPFREKHYPDEWYNCNKHQMEIIADEVMYWDGKYNVHNDYSTTNKKDADFIQFVYTSLGYRSTISTNDRTGRLYYTCGKLYERKSIEYMVRNTKHTLVGMNHDKRISHSKTKINKYQTLDGYKYCFEVPSHMLVLRRNNKIFITGNCGKSFTTSSIIKMLDDNHKSYRLMSPTGKAAQVLRDYTGRVATTIHIGLGYRPDGRWEYNKDNPIPTDVVIVDEFSMVDIYLFKILLSAIDFNRTKLLIVGDNAQLNSVGTGNCLHNLITSKKIPVTELTKIFRYSDGGLMKVATDIRHGKKYLDSIDSHITVLGRNKDYVFIQANNEASVKTVISLYKKLIDGDYSPKDIMVLAAYNKGEYGTVVINKELQKIVNPNYGSDVSMKVGNITYYVGDIVLQTKNDYRVPVYGAEDMLGVVCNGSTGVIKDITHDSMIIEFEDVEYEYSREMMNQLLLGYAMSIHKSQGSSSKIVIALTPSAHTYLLSSNILYVALTRMKEKCFHIGDLKTVNRAIKKKVNLMRDTFLEELLEN